MKNNCIIGILTTKNRPALLKRAVLSIISQSHRLDHIIICSDSDNSAYVSEEKSIAFRYRIQYIQNTRAHNCSGVRNSAIICYIKENILQAKLFNRTYMAFLDDDDVWDVSYIEKCRSYLDDGPDFVTCGLVYIKDKIKKELAIYESLKIDDFLQGNPHIQGSNTFIKLSMLLKCGMFDENLSSSVDRDLFVRIFQLSPIYYIIREYLVNVDVSDDRERVTNNIEKKRVDTAIFYKKYSALMSQSVRENFWNRNELLFGIRKEEIDILNDNCSEKHKIYPLLVSKHGLNFRLIIGVIITTKELGLRLIDDVLSQPLGNVKFVIIKNYSGRYKDEIYHTLSKSGKDFYIKAVKKIESNISFSRNLLFSTLQHQSQEGDVVWIVDDDMQLSYISNSSGEKQLTIEDMVLQYINNYDAIIGDYTLDPPLPVLATLRTQLLDYTYHYCFGFQDDICIKSMDDYYYDLSERSGEHLETPFCGIKDFTLKEIFSGKATARPLLQKTHPHRFASCCGGNVLIFNHALLTIPHFSISLSGFESRRSDYMWVLESLRRGYKIANVSFATLHNRKIKDFCYKKEEEKLFSDIIGAAFTKAIKKCMYNNDYNAALQSFIEFIHARLAIYIASYFRIMGLLQIIDNPKYSKQFTEKRLNKFVNKVQKYVNNQNLPLEWNHLLNTLLL